ncbi:MULTISPECIES: hypothetical protein, partial [unclassified Kosakonia]|uniref:hypothetical protein n=1 Tax=unclassified Kosakonia TaxID=2632876 RepID=UPI001F411C70
TLSFPLRFADFSGDTTPIAVISQIKKTVSLKHCPMALRLSGLRSAGYGDWKLTKRALILTIH